MRSVREEDLVETKERHPFKDVCIFQLKQFADGGILNPDKKEIYYIGIIDILTEYGVAKKFEFFGKLIYHCSMSMSCVPAETYQSRFVSYMDKKIIDSNSSN